VIVGVVVGVVVLLAVVAVLLWLFVFRKNDDEDGADAEGARETTSPVPKTAPNGPASANYSTQENPLGAAATGYADEDF
jgi:flagellar basal body-associated protein FliL